MAGDIDQRAGWRFSDTIGWHVPPSSPPADIMLSAPIGSGHLGSYVWTSPDGRTVETIGRGTMRDALVSRLYITQEWTRTIRALWSDDAHALDLIDGLQKLLATRIADRLSTGDPRRP